MADELRESSSWLAGVEVFVPLDFDIQHQFDLFSINLQCLHHRPPPATSLVALLATQPQACEREGGARLRVRAAQGVLADVCERERVCHHVLRPDLDVGVSVLPGWCPAAVVCGACRRVWVRRPAPQGWVMPIARRRPCRGDAAASHWFLFEVQRRLCAS